MRNARWAAPARTGWGRDPLARDRSPRRHSVAARPRIVEDLNAGRRRFLVPLFSRFVSFSRPVVDFSSRRPI